MRMPPKPTPAEVTQLIIVGFIIAASWVMICRNHFYNSRPSSESFELYKQQKDAKDWIVSVAPTWPKEKRVKAALLARESLNAASKLKTLSVQMQLDQDSRNFHFFSYIEFVWQKRKVSKYASEIEEMRQGGSFKPQGEVVATIKEN